MTEQERRRPMDSRERLAVLLFETSANARKVAWSAETQAYWEHRADALQSQAAEIARLRGALKRIELNAHTTGRIAIRDEARATLAQQGGDN